MRCLTTWTVLVLLTSSLTGCQKFRQLTRRDYASMEDPFAQPFADDSRYSSQPPSPALTASHSREVDSAGRLDSLRVSGATLTNEVEAAATDFVERTEAAGAAAIDRANPFAEEQFEAIESQSLEEMGQFLGNQAAASGLTETAHALDEEFTAWAAEQKQEWQRDAAMARGPVSQGQPQGTSAADRSRFAIEPLEDDVATPFIQRTAAEVAPRPAGTAGVQPLGTADPFAKFGSQTAGRVTLGETISSSSAAATPASPAEPDWHQTPNAAAPVVTPDVVEDPFADFGTPAPASPPSSIDAQFHFDTGWKPSSVERP